MSPIQATAGEHEEYLKVGKEGADRIFDLFRTEFRALVVPTSPQFAHVDAVAVTTVPRSAFFVESMSRRVAKGRYQDTMFGRGQYEGIAKLHEETGFPTYLVILFTDAIGYIVLPDDRAVVRREGTKYHLDLAKFTWLDPATASKYLG